MKWLLKYNCGCCFYLHHQNLLLYRIIRVNEENEDIFNKSYPGYHGLYKSCLTILRALFPVQRSIRTQLLFLLSAITHMRSVLKISSSLRLIKNEPAKYNIVIILFKMLPIRSHTRIPVFLSFFKISYKVFTTSCHSPLFIILFTVENLSYLSMTIL